MQMELLFSILITHLLGVKSVGPAVEPAERARREADGRNLPAAAPQHRRDQIQLVAQRVEKDTEIQADKDRTASLNRALLDGYAAEEDRINLAIAGIGSLKV